MQSLKVKFKTAAEQLKYLKMGNCSNNKRFSYFFGLCYISITLLALMTWSSCILFFEIIHRSSYRGKMETFSPFSNLTPWHGDQLNLQMLESQCKPISSMWKIGRCLLGVSSSAASRSTPYSPFLALVRCTSWSWHFVPFFFFLFFSSPLFQPPKSTELGAIKERCGREWFLPEESPNALFETRCSTWSPLRCG